MSEQEQNGRSHHGAQTQQVKPDKKKREQATPPTESSPSDEPEPQEDSFQPILSEQYVRRSSALSLRPRVRARVALVLVGANGRPRLFAPDKRPTVGELFWGGAGTLYEVDMSLNRTSIQLDLPSFGDTVAFHVTCERRVARSRPAFHSSQWNKRCARDVNRAPSGTTESHHSPVLCTSGSKCRGRGDQESSTGGYRRSLRLGNHTLLALYDARRCRGAAIEVRGPRPRDSRRRGNA